MLEQNKESEIQLDSDPHLEHGKEDPAGSSPGAEHGDANLAGSSPGSTDRSPRPGSPVMQEAKESAGNKTYHWTKEDRARDMLYCSITRANYWYCRYHSVFARLQLHMLRERKCCGCEQKEKPQPAKKKKKRKREKHRIIYGLAFWNQIYRRAIAFSSYMERKKKNGCTWTPDLGDGGENKSGDNEGNVLGIKQGEQTDSRILRLVGFRKPLLCQLPEKYTDEVYAGVFPQHQRGNNSDKANINPVPGSGVAAGSNENQGQGSYSEETVCRNVIDRVPFGWYVKVFAVLLFMNAPPLVIFGGLCILVCHVSGVLEPLLKRIEALSRRIGLLDRRSVTEILNELRVRRQLQTQAVNAMRSANIVFQELQEESHGQRNSAERQQPASSTFSSSSSLRFYRQIYFCSSVRETSQPSSGTLASLFPREVAIRLLAFLKWFYQLFIFLLCSLNPEWRPFSSLILEDIVITARAPSQSPPQENQTNVGSTAKPSGTEERPSDSFQPESAKDPSEEGALPESK